VTPTTHPAIIKTQELFDLPRDLFSHELDLLRAVRAAQQKCTVTKGEAVAFFGDQTPTYNATAWDASQIEAQELTAALGRYMEADKRHRDAMEQV
jgi:hypothetical protein